MIVNVLGLSNSLLQYIAVVVVAVVAVGDLAVTK